MAKMQSREKTHTRCNDIVTDETAATTTTVEIDVIEMTNEEDATTTTAARIKSNLSQPDSRMMTKTNMIENKRTGEVAGKMIAGTHEAITTDEIGQSTDATTEVETSAEAIEGKTSRNARNQGSRNHFKKKWRMSADSICSRTQRPDG